MDVAAIAAAIGEPARARMLETLMDGHARTSTELAIVGGVTPSTASTHLNRLKKEHLVRVHTQGKHRYYSLHGPEVARALEALNVLAGRSTFVPNTPVRLRTARTCYDHIAGALGVAIHDRFRALHWLSAGYKLSETGTKALDALGVEIESGRRRFAYGCLDWSERTPHIGGALGAAILSIALKRKWVRQDLDSRALAVTDYGRRELLARFGVQTDRATRKP